MSELMRVMFIALLLSAVTGCGGSSVAERVSSAEMAYAVEDMSTARRICDELAGDDGDELTAGQLGRLSVLYMQLYDRTDDSDALDSATKCYRSAFAVDSDSAAYFYAHLPVEQYRYAMSLAMLVQSIDNPADISDEHDSPNDSID